MKKMTKIALGLLSVSAVTVSCYAADTAQLNVSATVTSSCNVSLSSSAISLGSDISITSANPLSAYPVTLTLSCPGTPSGAVKVNASPATGSSFEMTNSNSNYPIILTANNATLAPNADIPGFEQTTSGSTPLVISVGAPAPKTVAGIEAGQYNGSVDFNITE